MILGFDVGGTNARGLLVDPTTRSVIDRARASSAGPGAAVVATLVEITRELERANAVSVDAVGLGVAGLVTTDGVVRYSPNLAQLVEFPLGPELSDALGIPVTAMNDATTGTWAEAKLGAGRGADDFAFVALGTGIGTGFVVGGQLVHGAHGFAGEAGHMVVDADGPAHITGQQGPWEYYASGSALGRRGREAAHDGRFDAAIDLAGGVAAITGLHVADALAAGDDDAARVFDEFCRDVARGCANLVVVLDPQRIVIGGGLTGIGEPLRRGVDDWLHELLLASDHRPRVEVRLAELGDDAGALGAALVAIDAA
ncbi:MAG: ROK family protein [Acidimicrobiales bacterium]